MTQETKIGVIRSFMGEELTLQEKLTIVRKRYHEHKQQKTIARELCCNQPSVAAVPLLRRFGDKEAVWSTVSGE